MNVRIDPSWKEHLAEEFQKPYFEELIQFVKEAYKNDIVYPPAGAIFRAFDLCPFDQVKVVILGQDPYHGPGQANGLCFSVNDSVPLPPSLINIYKEIENDLQVKMPHRGNLEGWAKQGVLLLNATLTVSEHKPASHHGKGWEQFTDAAISKVSEDKDHVVFILWGRYAQDKGALIDEKKHLILKAAHPSPFSANKGFFGCKHFSQANAYLEWNDKSPIAWENI